MRGVVLALAAAAAVALPGQASAKEYVVKMLNKGSTGPMAFEPAYLKVAPGDTIKFVPTDKSHNAESIPGMLPPGAIPFRGAMNKEVSVKVTKPGIYGIKCLPHYAMGMVAVIVAGNPASNAAASRKVSHPGRAKQVMSSLLAKVK